MGRPVNPESKYRIKPHVTNGYTYASPQPPYENPSTGKKSYRYVHWGLVDKKGQSFFSWDCSVVL